MKYNDIKRHLTPYIILKMRKTTINHAFAAAVSPCDKFDAEIIKEAILLLGQDPDKDLLCVYCGKMAETWDHVFSTVRNSAFSGAGHRIGNLLPSCKPCNSRKGGKNWETYLDGLQDHDGNGEGRKTIIKQYLKRFFKEQAFIEASDEHKTLNAIRLEILELMGQADLIAESIRSKRVAS